MNSHGSPQRCRHRVRGVRYLALLLILMTGGCGFQPRGTTLSLDAIPAPVHISGIRAYSPLWRELTTQLQRGGVATTVSAADSASVLHISAHRSDARVMSVDSRNKAVEYELEEAAGFVLRRPGDAQAPPEETLRVLRILYQPQDAVLGSNREAELLRADMRRELAQRILRRLAAR